MSKPKHPTIELVSFTASEALLNDESLINPIAEAVLKSQGSQHFYTGKCLDDGEASIRFVCVVWDAYEDHQRLIDDPTAYPKLLEDFSKCMIDGEFTMCHFPVSGDTTKVFTAPVTEIATVRVKGQGGRPELHQLFADWADAARNAPLAKEYQPFVFGQTLEKADVYYMLGGWATKDHHLNCVDTELKREIGLLADQTEHLKVNHCTLRECRLGGL